MCKSQTALRAASSLQWRLPRLVLRSYGEISHLTGRAGHKGLHGFLYGEEGAEAHDDTEEEKAARVTLLVYLTGDIVINKITSFSHHIVRLAKKVNSLSISLQNLPPECSKVFLFVEGRRGVPGRREGCSEPIRPKKGCTKESWSVCYL